MTRRETIVTRITELEKLVKDSTAEIESLKEELTTTAPDLLDRDPDAETKDFFRQMNEHLRQEGYLPPKN